MTCREGATDLGAYVLGALEPAEARRVEGHVRGCAACAAELAGFRTLPPLLDRVRPEDLDDASVAPSPDLFERMSAAAAADRSRGARRRRLLVVAAAVIGVLVAGGAAWAPSSGEQPRSVVAGEVRMTVTATAQDRGTALDVDVAGVPARTECTLVVVDADGNSHRAGEWSATYAGEASFTGWSDVDRADVADVVLLGTDGTELVRVPL
jgi:anti-sigma factor RsiW